MREPYALTRKPEPVTETAASEAPTLDAEESRASFPLDALAHALLSAEDEADLAKRIEAGLYAAHLLATWDSVERDSEHESGDGAEASIEELEWMVADGHAARETFVNSNLRLAMATSRKFRSRGFTDDDVLQDAYHGLVKAVDRFDYTKGFKFSTYAVWWIRESILTGVRAAAFVEHPEVLWNHIIKVRAIRLRLIDETGHQPTAEEIAAESRRDRTRKAVTVREVQRALVEDRAITSLDTFVGEDEDLTLGDLVSDSEAVEALLAVEDRIYRDSLIRRLNKVIEVLDPVSASIVRARFGLDGKPPRGLSAIAAEVGLSRQTVRMREQAAMRRLKHPAIVGALHFYRPSAA